MYTAYFGLRENPFCITPDPSYLYLSPRHREALAHLLYGTGEDGGFVQLTGEVGTGKTTLIRALLEQSIEDVDVALCLNPRLTVEELVAAICDELHADYPRQNPTLKLLIDALNAHLLKTHAAGRRTVLIIDEAQNLSRGVMEQVRLLTNLETHRHKLLRIILVGQPELQELLARPDLRQLAQRITARYHLAPLGRRETAAYIVHRLRVAGGHVDLFTRGALRTVYGLTRGVPRLINIICDRALMGAYGRNRARVSAATVRRAAREILQGPQAQRPAEARRWLALGTVLASVIAAAIGLYVLRSLWLPTAAELVGTGASPAAAVPEVPKPSPVAEPNPPPAADAGPTAAAAGPKPTSPPADKAPPPPAPEAADASAQTVPAPAAPPEPVATGRLAELVSHTPASDDPMPTLLALWGEELRLEPGLAPCEQIKTRQLRCLSGRGDWKDLRLYNRPAILRLATPDGRSRELVLRSLVGQTATLEIADRPVGVNLNELTKLWTGDYLLFWRTQTSVVYIGPGSQGDPVRWVRRRLALAEGRSPPEPLSADFDPDLQEQVRRFQHAHNLPVDGVVGPRTMPLLNDLAPAPGTPHLTTPSTDSER